MGVAGLCSVSKVGGENVRTVRVVSGGRHERGYGFVSDRVSVRGSRVREAGSPETPARKSCHFALPYPGRCPFMVLPSFFIEILPSRVIYHS